MPQPLDEELLQRDARAFVGNWRKLQPLLEEIRRNRLHEFDAVKYRPQIDALLTIAAAHAKPRLTSGLVEMQRKLKLVYERQMQQNVDERKDAE